MCFKSATILAAVGIACAAGDAAAQNTVHANVRNSAGMVVSVTGPGERFPAMAGGMFDLHAAADAGQGPFFAHVPAAQPAAADVWPVRTFLRNSATTPGLMERVATRLNPTPAYARTPKVFNGTAVTTGPVMDGFFNARTGGSILATGESVLTCTALPRGRFSVDSAGSIASVVRTGNPGRGARAADLSLDPINYSDVRRGDVLSESFNLPSDFGASITDPDGWGSMSFEVGANVPGLSPGELGMSHAGNPLLFRLTLSFNPSRAEPEVWMDAQPSSSGVQFFDAAGMPVSDISSYVTTSLRDSLVRDVNGDWSLGSEMALFSYSMTMPSDVSMLQVDFASNGMAEAPSPTGAAVMGLACVAGLRRRRAPRERC